MKQCPICGSGKVKEYKAGGVWELICYKCGYSSAQKDKHHNTHDREREREERGKAGR